MSAPNEQPPPPPLDEAPPKFRNPDRKPSSCRFCGETTKVQLCSLCLEVGYCSSECQKEDWKNHKLECRINSQTNVDLHILYPFIAWLSHMVHQDVERHWDHPALSRQILNSEDDQRQPCDIFASKVLRTFKLGDPCNAVKGKLLQNISEAEIKQWWPQAPSKEGGLVLLYKIGKENGILPCLIPICFALLPCFSLDLSHKLGKGARQHRLTFGKYAIVDFGIARGRVKGRFIERTEYHLVPENELLSFHDPDDHYWLYFTTSKGHNIILDCHMAPWGWTFCVSFAGYNIPLMGNGEPYRVPACLVDPTDTGTVSRKSAHFKERQRFSAMHDKELLRAIHAENDEIGTTLCAFMDKVAGRRSSEWEREVVKLVFLDVFMLVGSSVFGRQYLKWPKKPDVGILIEGGLIRSLQDSNERMTKFWVHMYMRDSLSSEEEDDLDSEAVTITRTDRLIEYHS